MNDLIDAVVDSLDRNETVVLATVIRSDVPAKVKPGTKMLVRMDGSVLGPLAETQLAGGIVDDCLRAVREGEETRVVRYAVPDGEGQNVTQPAADVYLEIIYDRPSLLIVGAGHIGVPLTKIGKILGFEVTIIDDRADFANADRLPDADRVIAADMGETLASLPITRNTYIILVTRGHKYDEGALRQVINSDAAYIGMIGSRTRVRTVMGRLIRDGFPKERVDSVYAPIGIDIGAQTPEEIAVSILAEVVKIRRGGSAPSIRDLVRR